MAGWRGILAGKERERRMAKKRVYVETSVISYLTAWLSNDLITLARQLLTRKWWTCREQWELFISPFVLDEITEGDVIAAAERLAAARELPVLPEHQKAKVTADKLAAEVPIPNTAIADAAHLALSAFHGMDYLVTWNQTHLDNPDLRGKIEGIIRREGLSPAIVLTPERLLETDHD